MVELGWDRPETPDKLNFTLLVVNPTETVLHRLVVLGSRSLAEVYGVRADDEWSIAPTELRVGRRPVLQDPDLFEIFHEGDVVHRCGVELKIGLARSPPCLHGSTRPWPVISCRLGQVRSATPYRDGTGALDLPFIAGVPAWDWMALSSCVQPATS